MTIYIYSLSYSYVNSPLKCKAEQQLISCERRKQCTKRRRGDCTHESILEQEVNCRIDVNSNTEKCDVSNSATLTEVSACYLAALEEECIEGHNILDISPPKLLCHSNHML